MTKGHCHKNFHQGRPQVEWETSHGEKCSKSQRKGVPSHVTRAQVGSRGISIKKIIGPGGGGARL